MLDALYNQLIKAAINQNQRIGADCRKICNSTNIPFGDRKLNIRWVKIPTFIKENKPSHYAVFLVDIPYWRKGELKAIYKQCIETIDNHDIDSYTIFLVGHLYGYFDPLLNKPMKNYKTFIINKEKIDKKERALIINFICKFIEHRIRLLKDTDKIFGGVQQDIERLQYFVETFTPMRVITCAHAYEPSKIKRTIKSTSNVSFNISHITREGGNNEG